MLPAHALDLLLRNFAHRTDNRQQLARRGKTARQGIAQPGGAHQQRLFIAGKRRVDNLVQLRVGLRIHNHQTRIARERCGKFRRRDHPAFKPGLLRQHLRYLRVAHRGFRVAGKFGLRHRHAVHQAEALFGGAPGGRKCRGDNRLALTAKPQQRFHFSARVAAKR